MSYDPLLEDIAAYVSQDITFSEEAYETASLCLLDSLGCALLALQFPECRKLLGPMIEGTTVPKGSKVLGTSFVLDPAAAAFNMGTMIRWLDYNDTWLAAEWGHPSDNLGAILSVAQQGPPKTVNDVLNALIKAYEIQGILALENSLNRIGFDHVLFVKVASAAVATQLLGGNKEHIMNALSQAFIDAGPLRTYRHAPNTGSRKSWAAGDATKRGVELAYMTLRGEMGYRQALTAEKWGFYDVLTPLKLPQPFGSYVVENILFKVLFPAEFHAQTAVESALKLHPLVCDRLDEIESIVIETQESAIRIIDKTGPLHNAADRDHCLQYMVAVPLVHGTLTAEHYNEETAQTEALRRLMVVKENASFSQDYLDPNKRSIANSLQVHFKDGSKTDKVTVEYPIGHRNRRAEAKPLILEKFRQNAGKELSEQFLTLIHSREAPFTF